MLVSNWLDWWKKLSIFQKYLPVSLLFLALNLLDNLNSLNSGYLISLLLLLLLSYSGALGRYILRFFLPLLLTFFFYDSQRFYEDIIRGPIHIAEPYLFDKTYFGIKTNQGILTPNEWFQLHTSPILDLITGSFYLLFILTFVSIAGYFYFVYSRKRIDREKIENTAIRMIWSFFWLNVIGCSTYYWYPAAPPWYVALYGLGPVKMNVLPSAAGGVRFDQLLGTSFFHTLYGHSVDVFGSIPSLHVAYPFQAIMYSLKLKRLTMFSLVYYFGMCFSAVYLNHHYVRDVILGSFYALITTLIIEFLYKKLEFNKTFSL